MKTVKHDDNKKTAWPAGSPVGAVGDRGCNVETHMENENETETENKPSCFPVSIDSQASKAHVHVHPFTKHT